MTSLSTQHFPLSTVSPAWDAANRLIRISDLHPTLNNPAHVSEFTYDGLWRRVEIKEKQGVQTVADRHFIWAGANIKEERDASNATVKRFYGSGVQVVTGPLGGVYVYQRDHLGSIRGVLDSAGNQVAAYDYDVWGNRTQTAGTFVADFGYAGYFEHAPSGLKLTWFRGYSPLLGRWINRDPIEEWGGLNLYGYAGNSPIDWLDPYGLCPSVADLAAEAASGVAQAAGGGIMTAGGGALVGGSAGPWAPATLLGGSALIGAGLGNVVAGGAKVVDAFQGGKKLPQIPDDAKKVLAQGVGQALGGETGKKLGGMASDAYDWFRIATGMDDPNPLKQAYAWLKAIKKAMGNPSNSPANPSGPAPGAACELSAQ